MHSKKIKVQNQYALNGKRRNGKPKDIVLLCEVHSKKIMIQIDALPSPLLNPLEGPTM
jgi:hypothetical protein